MKRHLEACLAAAPPQGAATGVPGEPAPRSASTRMQPDPRGALLAERGWTAFAGRALALSCARLRAGAQPGRCRAGSAFHMSDYAVALVGKIMCYAICALAMDLIWGYTGILSLGHGLFFALGGYAMGMYLMRQIGRDGNYKSDLPDFMVFLDWKALPWHWTLQRQLRRADAVPGRGWCRGCWRSCSASSPSARASRACTSRSSRRR